MSEWKEVKINEIGKVVTGNTPASKNPQDFGSEMMFVTPSDYGSYVKYINNTKRFLSDSGIERLANRVLPENSIMVTCIGSDMGKVAMNPLPVITNQQINSIVPFKDLVDPHYVYYKLIEEYDTLRVLGGDGTALPIINKSTFENISILLPSLSQQKSIAEVLSSLDDKIDLLHQQNKTLEALAETLFREWFVEEAEEEWQIKPVGEIFETVGGGTPSTNAPEFWDGNINWTSPKDLSNSTKLFMTNTSRTITEAGLKKISSGLLPHGTVLLSSRAPIGYLAITDIPVSINQGYIACLANKKYSSWYIHNWIKQNIDVIINAANGSTFLEISKSVFRKIEFVVPPDEKLSKFNQHAESYYNKIKINENQIQTLETLRNNLLPKLMSGALIVSSQ